MGAYENLLQARSNGRPTALSFIEAMFQGFIEFSGDRAYGDDRAVVGGIAMLRELPVTVIGIEKGSDTEQKIARNFGSAHPEGYRKALRLMKQAEKFHRPVFCIVDTAGAYCGIGAEERGQGMAIADNLMAMMALKVPVVSLLIGEGGSGGALALAVSDQVWMLENAVYSVISPEGAASIIWKDASKTREAAESLKITADDLLKLGVIDRVFSEKEGFSNVYIEVENTLYETFCAQLLKKGAQLAQERYERFRKIGGENL
jgi:acetyl-CoA carboxylase carboxyl transferase subunit alpha